VPDRETIRCDINSCDINNRRTYATSSPQRIFRRTKFQSNLRRE